MNEHNDRPSGRPSPGARKPVVVETVSRREKLIALLVGGVLLLLLAFGVFKMGGRVSGNTLSGTIVGKVHTPYKEEQVTIGRKGLDARKKDGDYELRVVVNGTEYIVPVHKETYEAKKEGERFTFPRPPRSR